MNENKTELNRWYRDHDYDRVYEILSNSRSVALDGDLTEAASNLRLSYYFALISIRTRQKRHESAFEDWMDGMDVRKAMKTHAVAFHDQKNKWMKSTEESISWEELVIEIRNRVDERDMLGLIDMQEKLTGVSHNKWGFTIAMTGIWEVVCVDSNVKNYFDWDGRIDLRSKDGAEKYFDLVEKIKSQITDEIPPFLAQWSIYDMMKGEHTRHEPYFRHAYPFVNVP